MRRSPSAVLQVFDPDASVAELQHEFHACCHCGKYHPIRGAIEALVRRQAVLIYCPKCDSLRCPECERCVPVERQLDNMEAGIPLLTSRPVQIRVPG